MPYIEDMLLYILTVKKCKGRYVTYHGAFIMVIEHVIHNIHARF